MPSCGAYMNNKNFTYVQCTLFTKSFQFRSKFPCLSQYNIYLSQSAPGEIYNRAEKAAVRVKMCLHASVTLTRNI